MTAVSLAPAWAQNDSGYSEFYARYHRPLTCYLRMGFRDADVEAVAQETFCRALAHWHVVGNMTSPWPWLAVTARNLARNNIRDERASQAVGLDVFHESACSSVDVAEQVEAADALQRLAQAMSVLTPLQKRLVTVMVEEGLTGAQLARRLDMRPGAVRMHLCRMRLRLGERFAALGGVLGLAPAALLPALRRLARPRRLGVQQAVMTAGSTAFAVSAAVMAIAVGTGGFGAGASATPLQQTMPGQVLAASESHHGVAAPTRHVTPARTRGTATSKPAELASVGYRAAVSSTPTQAGRTADLSMTVSTPAGPLTVDSPFDQGGSVVPKGPCSPRGRC